MNHHTYTLLTTLLLSLLLTTCDNAPQSSNPSIPSPSKPSNSPSSNISIPQSFFLIQPQQVGNIQSGQKVVDIQVPAPLKIEKHQEIANMEGEELSFDYTLIKEGAKKLVQVEWESEKVIDMYIFSEKYHTKKKIGVGSTLQELVDAYPTNHQLWYTYVSSDHPVIKQEMVVFETSELAGIQFLIDNKGYIKDDKIPIKSDQTILQINDFDPQTKVWMVRVF